MRITISPTLISGRVTLCLARLMLAEQSPPFRGRRHLRGSVLPSVDLVQDVRQHEVPLPRRPAPAAMRRNMAFLMVRMVRPQTNVYEDPRTGFGSIAQTLRQAQVRDPSISREEVKAFLDGLRVNQERSKTVLRPPPWRA